LALLAVFMLALATVLVTRFSVNQNKVSRVVNNAAVLGEAGDALMGYALRQIPPGTLPCPDIDGDGLQDVTAAGCQSQRGLLPARTVNAGRWRDSSGASLWYAVEPAYTVNAAGQRNPSRAPGLQLDGQAAAAVVIAPGAPVQGQGRSPLAVADFLEAANADGNLAQYQSLSAASGNDQLLALEAGEFWTHVARLVLKEAGQRLADYRANCGEYPWAAPFGGPFISAPGQQAGSLPVAAALPFDWGSVCPGGLAPTLPGWLSTHWADQLYFRMCLAGEGSCLLIEGLPAASVLLSPGTVLAGQVRPSGASNQYFEGENVALPDDRFSDLDLIDHSAAYNDLTHALVP
jgi:hypothetical protein